MLAPQNIYDKSCKLTCIHLSRLNKSVATKVLKSNQDATSRQQASQHLIDYLCDRCHINHVSVIVHNRPRQKISNGVVHGRYIRYVSSQCIEIYNLTAVKQQQISISSFYDTLLHEFMHHYDTEYLRFPDSPHTAGFYKRILDLKKQIIMKITDLICITLKKGLLNCVLPCNDEVAKIITKWVLVTPEVKNEDPSDSLSDIIVIIPFDDHPVTFRLTTGVGLSGMSNTCLDITEI